MQKLASVDLIEIDYIRLSLVFTCFPSLHVAKNRDRWKVIID